MQIFVIALRYLSCCVFILIVGCSAAKNSQVKNEELLLEVYTTASESIYPPGKTLDVRIYSSGKTEFDHYSEEDLNKSKTAVPSLRVASIDADQLSKIQSALEYLDSENTKAVYQPVVLRSVDEWIMVTIRYKSKEGMKSITLSENDSHLHLDDQSGMYPKSLIELIKLNYQIGSSVRKQSIE